MDFPNRKKAEEPAEYYIISTIENEPTTGPSRMENSKNRTAVSNGYIKTEIKTEPIDLDVENSEFEEEYIDDDSETEYIQETSHEAQNSECNGSKKGRIRNTPVQLQMLADFMNNKDTQPDTEEAIRIMTDALNMIGPPTRTSAQWRRTWSILKYNNKKRKRHGVVDASEILKRTRLDHNDDADATNSTSSKTYDTNEEDIPNITDPFHSHILKKINSVLEQQTKQTDQLKKLNQNLEKLIDVLARKDI